MGESGFSVFSCTESNNVFFNDDIEVEAVTQALDASTSAGDPIFKSAGDKPSPYYKLASRSSPAYKSDTEGDNRGAYQGSEVPSGMMILVR